MGWFDWIPSRRPLERIKTDIDQRWKITSFGGNNLYPQEMHQIMLRSGILKKTIQVVADFVNGDGFTTNTEQPVNESGQTINDILEFASHDLSEYGGFALLLNTEGLSVSTVETIPFEWVRFGEPDNFGRHFDVKVSNNWEIFSNKFPDKTDVDAMTFPLWNPLTASENALSGDGMVLYYTGKHPHQYPLTTFDAVSNLAESDHSLGMWTINSIANGFHGLSIFRYPGQFESDEEKAELHHKLSQAQGVNGNGIFVVEVDEDAGAIIENVPSNNTDALFTNTKDYVRDGITMNYALPSVLLGITATGAVFNEQALIDAFIIMNTKTKNQRNIVARIFNSFGSWGEIIPQQILTQEEEESEVEEEVVEEEETEEAPEEQETTEEEPDNAAA